MINTAIKAATTVGRATVLAIGLAVMLAVLLGIATTANAAVGDPLKLGKINAVNKLTQMVGGFDGAMLRIDNNSTSPSATALELQVESGKPPMKVNSTTEVQSLNVDQVDGQSAGDFLPNDTYVVTRTVSGPGGGANRVASADCDTGDKLLGGGGTGNTDQDDQLLASVPFGQGWDVVVSDNGFASTLTAHAVCADFPPEH